MGFSGTDPVKQRVQVLIPRCFGPHPAGGWVLHAAACVPRLLERCSGQQMEELVGGWGRGGGSGWVEIGQSSDVEERGLISHGLPVTAVGREHTGPGDAAWGQKQVGDSPGGWVGRGCSH